MYVADSMFAAYSILVTDVRKSVDVLTKDRSPSLKDIVVVAFDSAVLQLPIISVDDRMSTLQLGHVFPPV